MTSTQRSTGRVKTYTFAEVSQVANHAADTVLAEMGLDDRDFDVVGLVVNYFLSGLKTPGISLSDAARENYECDLEEIRGWLT
ncbi:hypothetical protein [Streptomyces cacaoi]|uniref:Uncharacterized protein n=1 Tax=Streptomyces cacaoi TaxID=1898 RepID=A0A4Y3QYD8_STRCI|nr:hypothetical protein [Streptomyces cacaoi]GEB50424.1 hypothetical protein SCA03_29750 [Streptomyces cacaoi]